MSSYAIAWVIVVGAGLGGAAVFYLWLPRRAPLLRHLLVGAALAFFLLPAPVPNYDGQIAPAFVVAIFELFFQTNGAPGTSLRILGAGMTLVLGLVWAVDHFLLRRYRD